MLITKETIYIGLCLYIIGMVKDLKARINAINQFTLTDARHQMDSTEICAIYVKEIRFHIDIIE